MSFIARLCAETAKEAEQATRLLDGELMELLVLLMVQKSGENTTWDGV